jgi:succinyl-CoA:acetate CoA-transferase
MYEDQITNRVRRPALMDKVMTADRAAALFKDGMTVGMSGFTRAGDAKALPLALVERARTAPLHLTLLTGASLGNDSDGLMANAGVVARRMPFQADAALRRKINTGEVMFIDQHLSETAEQLRSGDLKPVDIAVIEAVAIRADGAIIPTMSVGNTASFAQQAAQVIVEINLSAPLALEGFHDIYMPAVRPERGPIPLTSPLQRIGATAIAIDPARIAAIVITDSADSPSNALPPDSETDAIARQWRQGAWALNCCRCRRASARSPTPCCMACPRRRSAT